MMGALELKNYIVMWDDNRGKKAIKLFTSEEKNIEDLFLHKCCCAEIIK